MRTAATNIWSGYEYLNRHGETVENVIRNRIACASHDNPTTGPLERTVLRLLKHAGRPELCERKHVAD